MTAASLTDPTCGCVAVIWQRAAKVSNAEYTRGPSDMPSVI